MSAPRRRPKPWSNRKLRKELRMLARLMREERDEADHPSRIEIAAIVDIVASHVTV